MKDERLLKGEPIASGIVEGEILVSKKIRSISIW